MGDEEKYKLLRNTIVMKYTKCENFGFQDGLVASTYMQR
jgi:hypothetical protein